MSSGIKAKWLDSCRIVGGSKHIFAMARDLASMRFFLLCLRTCLLVFSFFPPTAWFVCLRASAHVRTYGRPAAPPPPPPCDFSRTSKSSVIGIPISNDEGSGKRRDLMI